MEGNADAAEQLCDFLDTGSVLCMDGVPEEHQQAVEGVVVGEEDQTILLSLPQILV